MPDPQTHDQPNLKQPNASDHYEVTRDDLPLSCPMPGMSLWNSHPRVYLPIHKTGQAKCPYCGAQFLMTDFDPADEEISRLNRREF